jgi:D-alanyl-D-alanine carboxypeptidase
VAPGTGPYAVEVADPPYPVRPRLERPPAAGLLFDVDSGEVLWARNPTAERPIASLTKMLTALIVAERHGPRERVLISAKAPGVEGSRIGLLKPGTKVPLGGLLLGLLLASGNDAAVALAEHDAGTVRAFVKRMNRRAAELQLRCSRFAGPAGLQDTGNSSCAYDLAALARADLANEWVASTTRRLSAEVPFPVKGGKLSLANNHYFMRNGIAGVPAARVTGVKTGLTNGAGRCYVTTARLGGRHLGVVLLDSPDPIRQVPLLLRAGFASPPE